MKTVLTFVLLLIGTFTLAENVKLTLAQNPINLKQSYFILETDDLNLEQKIIQEIENNEMLSLLIQKNIVNEELANAVKPMMITTGGFIDPNTAGTDCLLGVSSCIGGMLFVSATGDNINGPIPPQGLYAQVGTKYVSGGPAAFTMVLWATGCVFGTKGIIELFRRKKKNNYSSTTNNNDQFLSSQEILHLSGLTFVSEIDFDLKDETDISARLIPYLIATLNR